MAIPTPMNSNDFIEQALDERIRDLEKVFQSDAIGFMGEVVAYVDDIIRNVVENKKQTSNKDTLTVVLTTPGGYIEVVQRIVETLRHHYSHVDFVVPNHAFSAGTVLVMSGDRIFMDYYSRLGPIDPQVPRAGGGFVPALGYLIQWERLLDKAKKGEITTPEVQLMIDGFDQAELYQYEQARELSISLLQEWLANYKFKNWETTRTKKIPVTQELRRERAASIAKQLNDTGRWHVHGHGISMEVLQRDLNLVIDDFGKDPEMSAHVRGYHNLLDDYNIKRGNAGVVHTEGSYLPFMSFM